MDSGTSAVLASLITGLTVVVGSIVSAKISSKGAGEAVTKQARAEHLSARRQSWVDSMRDRLSEFMALGNWLQGQDSFSEIVDDDEKVAKIHNMGLLRHRIDLMLSSHETEHMNLSKAMKAMLEAVIKEKDEDYSEALKEISRAGRAITKEAWEQSKTDMS